MKQENVLLKHLGIKPSLRMNLVSLCHPAKISKSCAIGTVMETSSRPFFVYKN